jgi:hypothetical protein
LQKAIKSTSIEFLSVEELNRLVQMRGPTRSQSVSEEHDQDVHHKERRREQNRIAQRKYRELLPSWPRYNCCTDSDRSFFSGRKISQQLKQTEEFALRAQLTLAEVAEGQTTLLRCPECAHCKSSAVTSEDIFNRMPMLSSLASSSGPTLMSQELVNLTNTTQESELLPATPQEDFYGDSLSLGKMDFEPSFLADNSLDIMSPASCIRDFRTAVVSPKLSNQPDSALTNNDAPSPLFSQQDIGNNFHQQMVQTDRVASKSVSQSSVKVIFQLIDVLI